MTEPHAETGRRALRKERRARRFVTLPIATGVVTLLGLAGIAAIGYALVDEVGSTAANAAPRTTGDAARPTSKPSESVDAQPGRPEQVAMTAPGGILRLADPVWVARVSSASGIPTRALTAYSGADLYARSELGCAVGWNTLAGIGFVESQHGTLQGGSIEDDYVARSTIIGIPLDGASSAAIADTDGGALDGDARWDRAVGPMQFIPDTWARWGSDGDGDGNADVNNIADAALTAARYLCEAHGTLDHGSAWISAIRSYNDSPDYQNRVAEAASYYASYTDQ